MSGRYLLILGVLLAGFWGALEFMQWQLRLGKYAHSPQRLTMTFGATALVAGGRASLIYEDRRAGRTRLLVRCREVTESLRLRTGDTSEKVCGLWLEILDLRDSGEVEIEVRWGDSAGEKGIDD